MFCFPSLFHIYKHKYTHSHICVRMPLTALPLRYWHFLTFMLLCLRNVDSPWLQTIPKKLLPSSSTFYNIRHRFYRYKSKVSAVKVKVTGRKTMIKTHTSIRTLWLSPDFRPETGVFTSSQPVTRYTEEALFLRGKKREKIKKKRQIEWEKFIEKKKSRQT